MEKLKIELGKTYLSRDKQHLARVISLIGKWSKKHPVVGEFYKMEGKKLVHDEGLFTKYEHWLKNGKYLSDEADSPYDLVEEYIKEKKS